MQFQTLGDRLILPSRDFGQGIGRQWIDGNEGDQPPWVRSRCGDGEGVGVMDAHRRVRQRRKHHRAFGQIGGGHHPGRLDSSLVHIREQIIGLMRLDEGRVARTDAPRAAAIGRQNLQNGR